MVEEAESKLGSLYKEKITFTDPNSGSKFNFIFAAPNKEELSDFFNKNEVVVKGVSKAKRDELLKATKKLPETQNTNNTSSSTSNSFFESEVYYDLISKELKNGDVGFGFSIVKKDVPENNSTKSLRPQYSWRQQTSLPWCEVATISPILENPTYNYYLFFQVRGVFWNGSGAPFWFMPTNGVAESFNIDGPKFTRFGGEDNVYDKFHVTWYDFDSGESRFD